jgi:DNA-directed RNA polymerase beta' subunit
MNIHVPQTLEAQAEAAAIMAVKYQVVSPQASRPVIGVIQDTMLGAYLLSGETLSKSDAFQVTQRPIEPPYTGLRILSLVVPEVWYSGCVEIRAGEILSGRFRKKDLGCSSGSLIHVIFNDCGPQATIDFIWELEQFTSRYLHLRGYTVGLNDLRRSNALEDLCQEEMKQAFQDVQEMPEMETNQRLNESRDILGSAAMAEISKDNQFYTMIYAGSKGSKVNITQIQGCIGQQNVMGNRIKKDWTNRTMTCYPQGCNSPESRGFVQHTYLDGLSPQEMYMCAMAGREGLIDTAIKTAQTGYVERRLMKCLENIVAHPDGSARDGETMLQFKYGDDGLDAMHIEQTEWGPLPVPLQRMAAKHGVPLLPGEPTENLIESWIARAPPEFKQEALDRLEKAKVAPGECVGAIAAQSIGERATQCTLNSVDYNEWLIIQDVDTCAGEFIDSLCDEDGPEVQYIPVTRRKALTIDKHGQVSWNKLIAVTRHPPGPMLKVTTQSGRTMTCTVSKSFLTLQNDEWVPTSGDELKIGMKVPLISHLPDIYKRDNYCGAMIANFMAGGSVSDTGLVLKKKYYTSGNRYKHIVHGEDIVVLERDLVLAFMNFGEIPMCLIGCSNRVAREFTSTYIAMKGTGTENPEIEVKCKKTHRDILGLLLGKLGRHSIMTPDSIIVTECTVSETMADNIVSIEEHVSSHKYVYDLTVDKTKNMVLLNGIAVRDTFHFAGVSSKNVTLGLPRLEEVLNLTKKIKTPLNTFKQDHRARDIVRDMRYIELHAGPVEMEDDLDDFWDFPDQGEYKGEPIRIEAEGDPIPIVQALREKGFDVAYSRGVYHAYGNAQCPESIGMEGAEWCKCTGEVVETTLGVQELMATLPEELARTIYSNDIHTVYKILGIEAARVTILKEIRKILAHYGIDLNVRHLLVLVDWMTQTGKLTPMTRHGLKKVDSDIIKRATFEEVVGVFIDAAIHEKKDPVDSISACILTGKTARVGANAVHAEPIEVEEEDLFGEWNGWAQQDKPDWLQSPASPVPSAPVSPYAPISPDYAPD